MLSIYEKDITLQTFADDKGATIYPTIKQGTYDSLKEWAEKENLRGAGIYASVNGMKDGRNKKSVTQLRAYYVDLDGLKNEAHKNYKAFELLNQKTPPSAIVRSKNGLHAYYYTKDPVPSDPQDFTRVIEGLIENLGGCPRTKDISRVLRLPGFLHMKDPSDPYLVDVIHEDKTLYYSAPQLLRAYPPLKPKPQPKPQHVIEASDDSTDWEKIKSGFSRWIPVDGRKHTVLMVMLGVGRKFGVDRRQTYNEILPTLQTWNVRTDPERTLQQNIAWAYDHGDLCTVAGLRSLGVDIPKLSRPQEVANA
jgi:hypothetical protein